MLARPGGMLYRTRWLVLFFALLIVAGAAMFGTGLFSSLKSGGFNDPASKPSKAQDLLDAKLVQKLLLLPLTTQHITQVCYRVMGMRPSR
jgi:hypothetical protein